MPAMLDDATENLYAAFSNESKPRRVEACECCITERERDELINTPLRELTPQQLSNYASMVFLTAGAEEDFRYFIPRILDLSIHGEFDWPDHEVVCKRLADGNWLAWPVPLRVSIMDLFAIAWEQVIASGDGWDVDELLCGFALTGMDIQPFLARLEAEDAGRALIGLYERNAQSLIKGRLSNAFWDKCEIAGEPIIVWFASEKTAGLISRQYGMTQD